MPLHHLGLATKDAEKTRVFYEDILGYKKVMDDYVEFHEGGTIRHIMFDLGQRELIAFMEPQNLDWVPDFDTGINGGLGTPGFFYHIALAAQDEEELQARRDALVKGGVDVSPILFHDSVKSIYFRDPNGLAMEFAVWMRPILPEDAELKVRVKMSVSDFIADPSKSTDDLWDNPLLER